MKIYIAGPMRGLPLYNFPAFFKAAQTLRLQGHTVSNPAETDMALGLDPSKPIDDPDQPGEFLNMREILRNDFRQVLDADAIVLLPGWETSTGATAERVVAHYSGRKIFVVDETGKCIPDDGISPHISFDGSLAALPEPGAPRLLWDRLGDDAAVKSVRLSLTQTGDQTAIVAVDIVDAEDGALIYDFGKLQLVVGTQQLIKLDAEVAATEEPKQPTEDGGGDTIRRTFTPTSATEVEATP